MQYGEILGLAPIHLAPVVSTVKMDDASDSCSTPKPFGVPDD
jgi:hypothetical protein